jgi:FKBP-type peptidyl-prolyl cis-trans isomerase (trigger factor)
MNARVSKIDNGEAFLEIEVGADKLEEGMQFAYRTVVKKVTVPGFRKGKMRISKSRKNPANLNRHQIIELLWTLKQNR